MTLTTMSSLGALFIEIGRSHEAEDHCRAAILGQRRTLGDSAPDTLRSIGQLGGLLLSEGRLDEAEPLCREALEGYQRMHGPDHPDTLHSITRMAELLAQRGETAESLALVASSEAAARRAFTREQEDRLGTFLGLLGRLQLSTGAFECAEANLTEAYSLLDESGKGIRRVVEQLSELYERWHAVEPRAGHDAQASEWCAKLDELPTTSRPATP